MAHDHHHHEEKAAGPRIVAVRGLTDTYGHSFVSGKLLSLKTAVDHGVVFWGLHGLFSGYSLERATLTPGQHMNPDTTWTRTKEILKGSALPVLGSFAGFNLVRKVLVDNGSVNPLAASSSIIPALALLAPNVAYQASKKCFAPNYVTVGVTYAFLWSEFTRTFLTKPYNFSVGKPANL